VPHLIRIALVALVSYLTETDSDPNRQLKIPLCPIYNRLNIVTVNRILVVTVGVDSFSVRSIDVSCGSFIGDRNLGRDVFFYSATNSDEPLGGLISNPSISVKNFLSMLEILVVASHRYSIVAAHPYSVSLRETGGSLMPTEDVLQPGHYDIHRGGMFSSCTFSTISC
jgi:hypothetical protein